MDNPILRLIRIRYIFRKRQYQKYLRNIQNGQQINLSLVERRKMALHLQQDGYGTTEQTKNPQEIIFFQKSRD